jgi:hypothetical protein
MNKSQHLHGLIAAPVPNGGSLLDFLPVSAPDSAERQAIPHTNPARLYGFVELPMTH